MFDYHHSIIVKRFFSKINNTIFQNLLIQGVRWIGKIMSKPALFLSKNLKTSLLVAAILKSYSAATCLMNFTQKSPSTDVIGALPLEANS
jgi:hypothetical protein